MAPSVQPHVGSSARRESSIVRREPWSADDKDTVIRLVERYGNQFSKMLTAIVDKDFHITRHLGDTNQKAQQSLRDKARSIKKQCLRYVTSLAFPATNISDCSKSHVLGMAKPRLLTFI